MSVQHLTAETSKRKNKRNIADSQNTEDLFGKRVKRDQMNRERDQT